MRVRIEFVLPDHYADDVSTVVIAVEDALPDDADNFEWDAD